MYRDINGVSHETYPTRTVQASKVDGNLLAFGLPTGDPLPDLVEYLEETVGRCADCIELEQKALEIWMAAVQPTTQGELEIDL